MSFTITPYQYPLLSIAAFSLSMLFFMLWRKKIHDAGAFIAILVLEGIWAIATVLEASMFVQAGALIPTNALAGEASSIATKIGLHKLSQSSAIWLHLAWLIFLLPFTRPGFWQTLRTRALLSCPPVLFTILMWTNEFHGLFWSTIRPGAGAGLPLETTLGTAGLASFLYGSALMLLGGGLMLHAMWFASGQQLGKQGILLACTLVPLAGCVIDQFKLTGLQSVYLSPFIHNLAGLLFFYGLMRYRVLNTIPVAYQNMVDGMRDGILILSLENQIVHANLPAQAILRKTAREMVGHPVDEVLSGHPRLLDFCNRPVDENRVEEIQFPSQAGDFFYEVDRSVLRDRYGYAIGRLVSMRDITKRVHAEHILRQNQVLLKQSEEKYRSLVENINEVIFTTDLHGQFTYMSPVAERYTGLSPESILGKKFDRIVYPDDLPIVEDGVEKSLHFQSQMMEFRIFDRNHDIRYMRAYTRPIVQDEQIVGLQGVATDVTDRRRVEEALERRASQLTLLNYIGEQIAAVIELKEVLDNATRLIQKHFGYYHVAIFTPNYERGELQMRATSGAFADFFPEDHHLKFSQGMVGWAATNKSTLLANDVRNESRYTNFYPDKIQTRSELSVPVMVGDKMVGVLDLQSPMLNAFDDNDVRVMETIADQIAIAMENARLYEEVRRQLKDREHRENMLRVQRDLLVKLSSAKSLDETLQLAVENLSVELRASRVAISLIDWDRQYIQPVVSLGYPLNRPILPISIERSVAGRVARNAQPVLIPNVNADPSGLEVSPGTVTLLCAPLKSNGQVIGVISMESGIANAFSHEDLRLVTILANSLVMLIERARLFEEVEKARTELEKRATALEEANASLRELDRLKSHFLANMSHELRTPLNSIIGFSEVLTDELAGALNDEQREFAQDILDSGKHLLKLINDLLDFSKIEAGHMALETSTFEVATLFEELRITISPLVLKKSQVLVFRQDGPLPPITADHLRIKQVFLNLLSNANKFTPDQGMITVSCRETEPEMLLFSIRDTGIGISPADHQLIFEEFRQVDGSLTREVPGSGLGLAISKRIVEMHHGEIWVESELGTGSTFFVRLPVRCSPDTETSFSF